MVKALRRFLLGEDTQKSVEDKTQSSAFMHPRAIGSYGTDINAGYTAEEYLTTLRAQDRADKFDMMRRSDAQVMMLLAATKNPIKAATKDIEAVDDSEEEEKIAELVKHILFEDMDQTFDSFLEEALTVIDFGHSVFEVTHKVVLNHPVFGNYNGIQSLGFRSPRTIERWNVNPDNGILKSITQYSYGDLQRLVDIPAEYLLLFTLQKEGANYEGISMLRPCYGNWFRKNEYLKLNAAGIEKFAIPTPLVKIPAGVRSGEAYDYLIEALDVYCSHQANYLTYPDGYEINLNTNPYDPNKVEVSIENEDARMARAFLANFLTLGQSGSSGSFALGKDLSDFFLGGIEHIACLIAAVINKQLIPQIVKLNFGPRYKYPKLKFSGITDKAGKEYAEVLSMLTNSKIIIPDEKLEEHTRDRYGMPKPSIEDRREMQQPNLEDEMADPDMKKEKVNPPAEKPEPKLSENRILDRILKSEMRKLGKEARS